MEFLGKLHETVVKYPMTDIWMDSCGEEELEYGPEERHRRRYPATPPL